MASFVRDGLIIGAISLLLVSSSVVAVDLTDSGVSVHFTDDVEREIDEFLIGLSDASTLDEKKTERLILEAVNVERAKLNRKPLDWNREMASKARTHSLDMAQENYYGHDSSDGQSAKERYRACFGGENMLRWPESPVDEEQVAERTAKEWMNSQRHRDIMLDDHRSAGVGVAVDNNGTLYVTIAFCG